MAFIREYMAEAGDPFSLRVPKKLRKLKIGRALGSVARTAVGFIPGVGGIASSLLGRLAAKYPQVPTELWEGFARDYGLDMGDPVGRPKKTTSRRKAAASGPKAKAAEKSKVRSKRSTRPMNKPASKGKGPSLAGAIGAAGGALSHLEAFGVNGDDIASILGGGKSFLHGAAKGGAGGFGGHRRKQNPANVKALNRSLRRVEGFEKLAARVFKNKLFKRVRGHSSTHCPPAKRGKR